MELRGTRFQSGSKHSRVLIGKTVMGLMSPSTQNARHNWDFSALGRDACHFILQDKTFKV